MFCAIRIWIAAFSITNATIHWRLAQFQICFARFVYDCRISNYVCGNSYIFYAIRIRFGQFVYVSGNSYIFRWIPTPSGTTVDFSDALLSGDDYSGGCKVLCVNGLGWPLFRVWASCLRLHRMMKSRPECCCYHVFISRFSKGNF